MAASSPQLASDKALWQWRVGCTDVCLSIQGGQKGGQGGVANLGLLPSLSHRRRSPSPVIAPKFVSLSIAAAAADLHRCAAASPLLVAAPCDADEYQVVVFLHGYLASNSFESQLFEHVASHGFVVVGPRFLTPY
uniref:Chlorophyllase n=1 Tax=Oryza meridionalis TaxID=40149 RepID=A0A0E0EFU1_9ORYZ